MVWPKRVGDRRLVVDRVVAVGRRVAQRIGDAGQAVLGVVDELRDAAARCR